MPVMSDAALFATCSYDQAHATARDRAFYCLPRAGADSFGHAQQNGPLTKNPVRGGPRTGFTTPRETWEEPGMSWRKVYQGKTGCWQGGTLADSK
jgi:hypothetical protein